jgi:hypothetical protein
MRFGARGVLLDRRRRLSDSVLTSTDVGPVPFGGTAVRSSSAWRAEGCTAGCVAFFGAP